MPRVARLLRAITRNAITAAGDKQERESVRRRATAGMIRRSERSEFLLPKIKWLRSKYCQVELALVGISVESNALVSKGFKTWLVLFTFLHKFDSPRKICSGIGESSICVRKFCNLFSRAQRQFVFVVLVTCCKLKCPWLTNKCTLGVFALQVERAATPRVRFSLPQWVSTFYAEN